MASVHQRSLGEVLSAIRRGEIQIPEFQRDFVWSKAQVKSILESLRSGIPLGTITLWEQAEGSQLFEPFFSRKVKGKKIVYTKTGDGKLSLSLQEQMPVTAKGTSGVIDGRQRLTSLLVCFGGATFGHRGNPLAGLWYYDLQRDLEGEVSPFEFEKLASVEANYTTVSDWVRKGRFPLWLWEEITGFTQEIANSAHYADSKLPPDIAMRLGRLNRLTSILSGLDLAFYVLDKGIDLSTVCEVFELLNTMGTKVSAFDIVAAKHFGASDGRFDLRERIKAISTRELGISTRLLSFWFDENSGAGGKTVCNAVTGAYLNRPENRKDGKRKDKLAGGVGSFKGADLIGTPRQFYQEFFDVKEDGKDVKGFPSLKRLDETFQSFATATCGVARRRDCPYPILLPLYLSLRFDSELIDAVGTEAVNDAFRVFFWRASLHGHYDQGFLTGAVKDSDELRATLLTKAVLYNEDRAAWWATLEAKLGGLDIGPPGISKDLFLADDHRGAMEKTLVALLFSRLPLDLKDDHALTRIDSEEVQLHHIFPRDWVTNNCKDLLPHLSSMAALVPLSAAANNEWSAQAPEQVMKTWRGSSTKWVDWEASMTSVLVDKPSFVLLGDGEMKAADRFKGFLDSRATYLAESCAALVRCAELPLQFRAWESWFGPKGKKGQKGKK